MVEHACLAFSNALPHVPTSYQAAGKQAWLSFLNDALGSHYVHQGHRKDDPCCFVDIADLHKGNADCCVHSKVCPVPKDNFFETCGFSCNNLSRLLAPPEGQTRSEMLQRIFREGAGTTGSTFSGLIAHLKQAAPAFVMWENVEDAMGEATDDGEILRSAFCAAGYAISTRLLDSSNYAFPQCLSRIYGVAMHIAKNRAAP